MRRLLLLLVLSTLLVSCESKADKLKRLCSAYDATSDTEYEVKAYEEIYKLSEIRGKWSINQFCRTYLGR